MKLSRRDFLKASAVGVFAVEFLEPRNVSAATSSTTIAKKRIGEKTSVCAYCAGGCGLLIAADSDRLVSIEGDPDHPISRGALCSKAQALYQIRTVDGKVNPRRLTKVLYRAPNSASWQEKSWSWALDQIAGRVKKTRDANWIEKDKDGVLVNRTEAIAHLGGSAHDNEECYLLTKMNRALGMVYIETQARI